MPTEPQTRDMLHRAAHDIDVAPPPLEDMFDSLRRRRQRMLVVGAGLVVVAVLAVASTVLKVSSDRGSSPVRPPDNQVPPAVSQQVPVPSLTGLTADDAQYALTRLGLRMRVETQACEQPCANTLGVLDQDPPPGTVVAGGSLVTLTFAAFALPDHALDCCASLQISTPVVRCGPTGGPVVHTILMSSADRTVRVRLVDSTGQVVGRQRVTLVAWRHQAVAPVLVKPAGNRTVRLVVLGASGRPVGQRDGIDLRVPARSQCS